MNSNAGAKKPGLQDLLIVAVEHAKLLLIVPIAVGAVVVASTYLRPMTYTSEAILLLPESTAKQAAMMMLTPLVTDSVIVKLDLTKDMPLANAREQVHAQVRTKVSREGLLRLETIGTSPTQARQMANAVLEAWRTTTVPGTQERVALEARLAYVQKMLKSTDHLLERLAFEPAASNSSTLGPDVRGVFLLSMADLQAKYFSESQAIAAKLRGVSPDVIVQQPSLPITPDPTGGIRLAILSAAATFLLLLIGVLARLRWRRTPDDTDNASGRDRPAQALRRRKSSVLAQQVTPAE
jgi:hypothetical protein